MKVYEFGQADAPAIMLLPGTEIHIFYALKMGKNTVSAICGTSPTRSFTSRACSTRSYHERKLHYQKL